MNVSDYLKTKKSKDLFIRSTEYPSYIHVDNVFIVENGTVVIDKQLDARAMAINAGGVFVFNSIVNVKTYYRGNYYDLIPGSFIGTFLKDQSNTPINRIEINGYVMQNGVLS